MPAPLQPLNQKQLQRLIDSYVAMSLKPQRQDFANQRRRTVEVAKAIAELQKGIGPATSQAFQAAAGTQGALAQGFTGALRQGAEADAAAAAEALARLGAPQAQIDQVRGVGSGAADAAYALGGSIPAGTLAREGANFAAAQNQLPATTLGRAQYDVAGIDRAERELDAQIPKIRGEIQNQLIGQEISKAELQLRNRAQNLYEAQYGESVRSHKANERLSARRASISEKNYRLAVRRHELAVKNAANQGRQVNAAASKGRGILVDQYGDPILGANGKPIKFKTGEGGASGADAQLRREAIREARDLRGEPIQADELDRDKGRYVKRGGGFTNDASLAERDGDMSFTEAVDYIASMYGVSRSKARAWVRATGWKPPRSRPRKSGR